MNVASFMLYAKFMLTYLPWVRARRLWLDRDCGLRARAWFRRWLESCGETSVQKLLVCRKTP